MEEINSRYYQTNKHIANKILMLRRSLDLTQEKFAEMLHLDSRTISRAEKGENRPSGKLLEAISLVFNVPVSYFYDNSIFEINKDKTKIINEINAKLNIISKDGLVKINKLIQFIDFN